jgi:hypothetical protein
MAACGQLKSATEKKRKARKTSEQLEPHKKV